MRTFCIASVVGILFGLLIGNLLWANMESGRDSSPRVLSELDRTPAPPVDKIVEKIPGAKEANEAKTVNDPPTVSEPSNTIEKEESQLFSKALIKYFRESFSQSWNQHRASSPEEHEIEKGEARFREAVLRLPAELAKMQAKDLNEKDAARKAMATGDGMELLEQAHNEVYIPDPTDVKWEEIDRCCERRASGDLIDGSSFIADSSRKLSTGATLHFPPGVHKLDERRLRGEDGNSMPSDILIIGDGMDATLLTVGDISPRSGIDRLRIQDITLYMENDGLFDVRKGGIVIDLDNVRFVGFDAGHGGCTIFSGKGALIRAHNVEFIGGYGRSPGRGDLFDHSAVLARFDNCRFEFFHVNLKSPRHNSRISFQNCVFSHLEEDPMQKQWKCVDFHDCITESVLEKGFDRNGLKKDLADLFPQWKGDF